MLNRRTILSGLIAAPAVVAIGSLMPIRGLVMPVSDLLNGEFTTWSGEWVRGDGWTISGPKRRSNDANVGLVANKEYEMLWVCS